MKKNYTPFEIPELEDDLNTVLILAGDIDHAKNIPNYLNSLSDRFLAIIHVAGNHEYYGSNLKSCNEKMKGYEFELNDNCYHLNNTSVTIRGQKFIGCALWTDLSDPNIAWLAQRKMNDYSQIRDGYKNYGKIKPFHTTLLNKESRQFIYNNCNNAVVITHHSPLSAGNSSLGGFNPYSYSAYNELDAAYYNNLEDFTSESSIKLWCYGHTHKVIDVMYFGTRIVTNAVGYMREESEYKNEVIEI